MVLLDAIMDALGEAYPWELAGRRDPGGLLIGSRVSEVRRVLCAIDLTADVVEAAAATRSELLVVHHPHLLSLARLPWDADGPAGRLAREAVSWGVNVAACYQNADVATGGAADLMASRLQLSGTLPLVPSRDAYLAKVVVFVPPEALEQVSEAMSGAGAGVIGDYTHAGFRGGGTGTFVPGEGASPYSGETGKLNLVEEVRLEMVCPSFRVEAVVAAILERHPYQEAAYDVYRTESPVPWGMGRVGDLAGKRTLLDIMEDLAGWSASEDAVLVGQPDRTVTRVAVAPGPGDRVVERACRQGAELLATGEVGWHATVEACERGLALIKLGHLESERALVPAMVDILSKASEDRGWDLEVDGYRDRGGRWG
jgi:dinuclear metal center YbgI/SA1388 family protein